MSGRPPMMDMVKNVVCRECGLMHPKIEGGCPMAGKAGNVGKPVSEEEQIKSDCFRSLKIRIDMEIDRKKIRNVRNFFMYINQNIDRIVGDYKEL